MTDYLSDTSCKRTAGESSGEGNVGLRLVIGHHFLRKPRATQLCARKKKKKEIKNGFLLKSRRERKSDFSGDSNLGKSKGTEQMGFPFQHCCFVSSSSSSKFILCCA